MIEKSRKSDGSRSVFENSWSQNRMSEIIRAVDYVHAMRCETCVTTSASRADGMLMPSVL